MKIVLSVLTAILISSAPAGIARADDYDAVYHGPFDTRCECRQKSREMGIRIPYDSDGNPGIALIPECFVGIDQRWYLKN
ncbi:hypothetical protein [Nocardia lasii]|uniref:Uncharacterized protein n=1 Tax=Nocardia lasii TaxID=1616107 RepID=A0ABW1JPB1_9NOCA